MNKKIYEKPSMKVIELQHQAQLLAGSADPYDGPFSYIPGMSKDEDHLA